MEGIKQELKRVRDLKRNAESTIELLRSDMEQGKIHLRVSDDKGFRQELAKAIVKEAHPGYHGMGYYYADPVEGQVYYREQNAPWNPWSEAVDWRIVPIDRLVDGGNFDPSVDWDVAYLDGYRDMVAAYLESEEEEFEGNGDIPDWVNKKDVINFASEDDRWKDEIEEIDLINYEQAISFALSEIQDEVVVEI